MRQPTERWLETMIRCHAVPVLKHQDGGDWEQPTQQQRRATPRRPTIMHVLDVETATEHTCMMDGFDGPAWEAAAQSLLFGRGHTYIRKDGQWLLADEWAFYPDALPAEGMTRLRTAHEAITWPIGDGREPRDAPGVRSHLVPLSEYLEHFWRLAGPEHGALVVGFNLAFDLSRLAWHAGPSKSRDYRGGFSFVLFTRRDDDGRLHPHGFRPRMLIKRAGSTKSFISWAGYKTGPEKDAPCRRFRGNFLDARQLAWGLTSEAHTLESACKRFGVEHGKQRAEVHGLITSEYVAYNRRDVTATFELAVGLLGEFDRHSISTEHARAPGQLRETGVYSAASMAKGYLRAMDIAPRSVLQPDFLSEFHGAAMTAYYGGRSETKIRKAGVPVVYTDVTSMYTTVNSLMKLWPMVVAERVEAIDDTEAVRHCLDTVTADTLVDKASWPELNAVVLIEPNGDVLPVRARYGGDSESATIGINRYWSGEPQWYALADLVAGKILGGTTPKVLRAIRFAPNGVQKGLSPTMLRGVVPIDPRTQDFFRVVVEERQLVRKGWPPYDRLPADERDALQKFLKVLANAGGYGIYAELNREGLPSGERARVKVYGTHSFEARTIAPETPGRYLFPPMAALITSAARLMLALIEHAVTEYGGVIAFCDTDSAAIVATREGGPLAIEGIGSNGRPRKQTIRALSWAQVADVVGRFERLNPYDPRKVPGSIIKIEDVNYRACGLPGHARNADAQAQRCICTKEQRTITAYAISAKRYVLYSDGQVIGADDGNASEDDAVSEVADYKESGLGMYVDPTGRRDKRWIEAYWRRATGQNAEPFPWEQPAVMQLTISTPRMLKPFERLNRGQPYAEQVKPFNFMLHVPLNRLSNDGRICLVAPYEPDPSRWYAVEWTDYHTGHAYRLALPDSEDPAYLAVGNGRPHYAFPKTHEDVFHEYVTHSEAKFLGPDGKPCSEVTRGVLQRTPVRSRGGPIHIGKESSALRESEILSKDVNDVRNDYGRGERDHWTTIIRPALRDIPRAAVVRELRIAESTVRRWRSGRTRPTPAQLRAIETFLRRYTRRPTGNLSGVECLSGASHARISANRQT